MQKKINLKENETDLVVMQHIFKIETADKKIITKKSTMISMGTKERSAMANTVGTPAAIATQLILDKIITDVGVLMPNKKSIY